MRILAVNSGSSSLKCALIDTERRVRVRDVRVENLGGHGCRLRTEDSERTLPADTNRPAAMRAVIDELQATSRALGGVNAVAHRIVHGGARFVQPMLLDTGARKMLDELSALAPLHNPPALEAVEIIAELLPGVPQVAVFDTAFHATLPKRAREYALPTALTERLGIRRFGFHGTSHAHVAAAVAEQLGATPQDLRIVSCHLGNGASVAAIEYGRSVETSMGMTPLEGLVMGTRAGDLDPGVLLHLLRGGEVDLERLESILNRESGLKGLTGTNDLREIEERAARGDEACRLAITLYAHRVRKYIGAYAAVMGGVDAIAFTGGIGENSALMRHRIAQRLDFLGARLDEDRNRDACLSADEVLIVISDVASRVRLMVVRADEEQAIALEAARLLHESRAPASLRIPIAVSARHAHLSQATMERLFGASYRLRSRAPLSQPGQFAAEETVSLIGPRGRIDSVRLLGPPREQDQVEISRSDEFVLGIDAPVRLSGDLANTPGITLEGPAGRVALERGVICARRHIHMSPVEAEYLGVRDHDSVEVRIDSKGRDLIFADVTVRVAPEYRLEMHLDTDEANAAGIESGDRGELMHRSQASATVTLSRAAPRPL